MRVMAGVRGWQQRGQRGEMGERGRQQGGPRPTRLSGSAPGRQEERGLLSEWCTSQRLLSCPSSCAQMGP